MENYHNAASELLSYLNGVTGNSHPNVLDAVEDLTRQNKRLVLIFDQFEKNLYDYSYNIQFLSIIETLLNHPNDSVKYIFSLRDDFTKNLWDFSKDKCLNLLKDNNLFTLYKPSINNIKTIITSALSVSKITIKEDELNGIIEDLLLIHQKNYIYFPDLQIVFSVLCDDCLKNKLGLMEVFKSYGNSIGIIEKYFSEKIWEDFTKEEATLCLKIINSLVSLDGIREQMDFESLHKGLHIEEKLAYRLLERLIGKRILKRFSSNDNEYYELVHDFMAKKYADILTEDEKVTKSLTEMVRHACMDWRRHRIFIDNEKLSLIVKNIENIELNDEAKKLILASLASSRGWQASYDKITKGSLVILEELLTTAIHDNAYTDEVLKSIISTLSPQCDVEALVIEQLEIKKDLQLCLKLLIAFVGDRNTYYWHQRANNKNPNKKIIAYAVGLLLKAYPDLPTSDKTVDSFVRVLINSDDTEYVINLFGPHKDAFIEKLMIDVISERYHWYSHHYLNIFIETSPSFCNAFIHYAKMIMREEIQIYLTVTFVEATRILDCAEMMSVFTEYLLNAASYGSVNLKKEMIPAIVKFDPIAAIDVLGVLLNDPSVTLRKEAALFLGKIGSNKCLVILKAAEGTAEGSEIPNIKSAIKSITGSL